MIPVRSAEGFTFTLNERGPQGSLHQGATEQALFAIQCLSQPAFLSENSCRQRGQTFERWRRQTFYKAVVVNIRDASGA